jgi:hypothetical protein
LSGAPLPRPVTGFEQFVLVVLCLLAFAFGAVIIRDLISAWFLQAQL